MVLATAMRQPRRLPPPLSLLPSPSPSPLPSFFSPLPPPLLSPFQPPSSPPSLIPPGLDELFEAYPADSRPVPNEQKRRARGRLKASKSAPATASKVAKGTQNWYQYVGR